MKITGTLKIKENITTVDLGDVIELVVAYMIRKNDNGGIRYTPYFKDAGMTVGIARYLLDGIEFEKNDNVLDIVTSNDELNMIVETFKHAKENSNYKRCMSFIHKNVTDIVEFEKQRMIHDYSDIKAKLVKTLNQEQELNKLSLKLAKNQNRFLQQQIKQNEYNEKVMEYTTPEEAAELNRMLLDGKFDLNNIMNMAMDKYLDSEIHKKNEQDIMDSQVNKIKDLEKYKKLHEARNVLADK